MMNIYRTLYGIWAQASVCIKLVVETGTVSLEEIVSAITVCTKCRLCQTRKNAVPGEGKRNAQLMFVGEAPGGQEDLQGSPFVGASGQLLAALLESIGLRRDEVYITNIVKCRPPSNRPPRKDETAACRGYLDRQIALIQPKVLCPLGNSAIRALLDCPEPITKIHGLPFESNSITYFPMYHPAAALYTPSLKQVMQEDFKKLRALLDSTFT